MLPSPRDIEQCLQDMADTHQAEMARLYAERAAEGDRGGGRDDPADRAGRRGLGEDLDGEVLRTVLMMDAATAGAGGICSGLVMAAGGAFRRAAWRPR